MNILRASGRRAKLSDSMIDPLEWAQIALHSETQDDAWEIFNRKLSSLGFTKNLYMFGREKQNARKAYPITSKWFGQSISKSWERFMADNQHMSAHDPIGRMATERDVCFVTLPYKNPPHFLKTHEEEIAFQRYLDFGLTGGAVMSVHDNSQGIFSFFSITHTDPPELFEEACKLYLRDLQLAVVYMTEAFQMRSMVDRERAPHLSPRERECLSWSAAGRSTKEIASILNLSTPTVNEYFANAQKKLGASSRTQACSRAFLLSLISP